MYIGNCVLVILITSSFTIRLQGINTRPKGLGSSLRPSQGSVSTADSAPRLALVGPSVQSLYGYLLGTEIP
jgi:hypothetical protein